MSAIPLEDRVAEIRAEFPATSRMGYFNTGSIGPIPRQMLERHQDLERRYHFGGPLDERLALMENTTAGVARITALCSRFKEGLAGIPGVSLVTPVSHAASAGLITLHIDCRPARDAVDALENRGMIVRTVPGDNIRASFHLYNTAEEVEALLGAVAALVA